MATTCGTGSVAALEPRSFNGEAARVEQRVTLAVEAIPLWTGSCLVCHRTSLASRSGHDRVTLRAIQQSLANLGDNVPVPVLDADQRDDPSSKQ
jgi:hypothetical protein